LDLAYRGLASQRLLDTYQAEREPHVTEIIRQSIAAGKLVCTTDPEAARRRDETFWSGQVPPPPPVRMTGDGYRGGRRNGAGGGCSTGRTQRRSADR
jgi:2-polyprenyl-6-methoxyphenol hydroxylase-like FAD-dependent oxidoreductase